MNLVTNQRGVVCVKGLVACWIVERTTVHSPLLNLIRSDIVQSSTRNG